MGNRTCLQIFVYACPEDQRDAALAVLGDDYSLDWGASTSETLSLDQPYTDEEASCGRADEVADELAAAAPGASFVLWEDPAYQWLGELHARTPELGCFAAECTSTGQVVFTLPAVLAILGAATDMAAARAQLHKAMGGPWMDDWAAARGPG